MAKYYGTTQIHYENIWELKKSKIRFLSIFWILIYITVFNYNVYGTTWGTAYPYTQQIEGQDVVIKAFPYDAYSGSPLIGVTKVYIKNKLSYYIDKYYRERIYTSNDGQFLAVLHTSNSAGVTSYTSFGTERLNFNQPAIEVYKNGQPFKLFTLKDVMDTAMIANNGRFFNWAYDVNFDAFEDAIWNCKDGKKNMTKEEKKECLNGDTNTYCKEWIQGCDSMKLFEKEKFIFYNSAYVENNSLFILTNRHIVIKLDFTSMNLSRIPFDELIPNKMAFNPPKFNRNIEK